MIVLLALLNDAAILSIAHDRGRSSDEPGVWNMQEILGIARALGLIDGSPASGFSTWVRVSSN